MLTSFESIDALFAHMATNQQRAEELTTPEQWAMGPGDFFLHMGSDFLVIGCIVGAEDEEDRVLENEALTGTQLARIFSLFIPDGELESTFRCNMKSITRRQFQRGLESLGLNPRFPVFLRDGTKVKDWTDL